MFRVEKVSVNGRIFAPADAKISAVDKGLMHGIGAFETFRVFAGKTFLLDKHFARLNKSLRQLNIIMPNTQNEYKKWVRELCLNMPKNKDARVRFLVTSGVQNRPNVIIYLSYLDKFKPTGENARILKSIFRHKPEYFAKTGFRIKSPSYLSAEMAQSELAPGTYGILLNPDGFVAEGLTANIFWAKNGKLYTPPLKLGILAGTIRGWIMQNFKVSEKLAKAGELLKADEIILSSGVRYVTALDKINAIKKPGINGPVFKELFAQLKKDIDNLSKVL